MAVSVYWIHHPEHTDMFTQGYIGITKDIKKRFEEHKNRPSNAHLKHAIKKYGWDNLVKEIVLVADKAYCLMIEAKLRAKNKIGWNVIMGGGVPPSSLGMKFTRSEEYKQKQSIAKKGKPSWNKGIPCSEARKVNIKKSALRGGEHPSSHRVFADGVWYESIGIAGKAISNRTTVLNRCKSPKWDYFREGFNDPTSF